MLRWSNGWASGNPIVNGVTFASLPAAASNAGQIARVTNIGPSGFGSLWVSNGTIWSPLGGTLMLKTLGAPVTGIANSETIVLQTIIPAGAWQVNNTIRVWFGMTKSGTTDAGGALVRIGISGTTADQSISGFSSSSFMASANQSSGYICDIKLLSSTTAQKQGAASSSAGSYGAASSIAINAANTIPNSSANDLYVSLSMQSSGTANTVGITAGQLQLISP